MTSCDEVREKLADYVYEVLPDWQMEEVGTHLDDCEKCAQACEDMVAEFRLLDQWGVPGPGEDGHARFMRRVHVEARDALVPLKGHVVAVEGETPGRLARRRGLIERWRDLPGGAKVATASVSLLVVAALVLGLVVLPKWQSALAQAPDAQRQQKIEALMADGKLEDAVEACRAWIKDDPQATKPHFLLAGVYTKLELWDRAQEELEIALDLNPASAAAHVALGDLFRRQEKLDEANQHYQQALAVDSRHVAALIGLTRTALEQRKLDEAAMHIDIALQIAPEIASVLALAGEMANRRGDFAEAAEKFKQALEQDPKCADALYTLGIMVQAQGAWAEDEAQKYWDRFLEAESDTERAWLVRNGLVQLSVREVGGTPGYDQRPVFSPDGKMLAFSAATERGNDRSFDLWVMPADGAERVKRVTSGGGALMPAWTPDGEHLLFDFLYEGTGWKRSVYVTNASGKQVPRCLVEDVTLARAPVAIPGTSRFAYTDGWSVFTMTLDGRDRQPAVTREPGRIEIEDLCVSPDGNSIAFAGKNWPLDGRPADIYAAALDGSAPPRKITSDDPSGRLGSRYPAWSPDGKRMLFASDVNYPKKSWDIFAVVLNDPHPPHKLGLGCRPTWSPGGTKIAFDRWTRRDPAQIFIMELGGKRLPIVKPEGEEGD